MLTMVASLHGDIVERLGSNSPDGLGNDTAVAINSMVVGRYPTSPIIGRGMFSGVLALIAKTVINILSVECKKSRTDPDV